MATKLIQYRRNIAGIANNWDNNEIAPSSGYSIVAVGIQTRPGVNVKINLSTNEAPSIIKIGPTGIYELDVKGLATIQSLDFSDYLSDNDGVMVIVDVLEEGA